MRFYAIRIDNAPAAFPPLPGAEVLGAQWCSVVNGLNDPGAQQVELEITEFKAASETPNCTVTIQNPPLQQLSQMGDLSGKTVTIFGGMWKGLPLATWHYSRGLTGFLASGMISRCWGSWVGTDMSLSFAFAMLEAKATQQDTSLVPSQFDTTGTVGGDPGAGPQGPSPTSRRWPTRYRRGGPRSIAQRGNVMTLDSSGAGIDLSGISLGNGVDLAGGIMSFLFGGGGTLAAPLNLVHNMMPNMPLSSAIQQTINTAFPGATTQVNVSDNIKLPSQDAGIYQSMTQYAAYLQQLSQNVLGTQNYKGIEVTTHGPSLNFWDKAIGMAQEVNYYDLIGQPTWIDRQTFQFKTVMRCDIHLGNSVSLPPGLMGVQAGAYSGWIAKQGVLNFDGLKGTVKAVRHSGDFRNPDGNAWCTIVDAMLDDPNPVAGTTFDTTGMVGGSPSSPSAQPAPLMARRVRRYR